MKRRGKKLLSALISAAMVASLFTGMGTVAFAEEVEVKEGTRAEAQELAGSEEVVINEKELAEGEKPEKDTELAGDEVAPQGTAADWYGHEGYNAGKSDAENGHPSAADDPKASNYPNYHKIADNLEALEELIKWRMAYNEGYSHTIAKAEYEEYYKGRNKGICDSIEGKNEKTEEGSTYKKYEALGKDDKDYRKGQMYIKGYDFGFSFATSNSTFVSNYGFSAGYYAAMSGSVQAKIGDTTVEISVDKSIIANISDNSNPDEPSPYNYNFTQVMDGVMSYGEENIDLFKNATYKEQFKAGFQAAYDKRGYLGYRKGYLDGMRVKQNVTVPNIPYTFKYQNEKYREWYRNGYNEAYPEEDAKKDSEHLAQIAGYKEGYPDGKYDGLSSNNTIKKDQRELAD